jgi:molecular chaperone Hsp33
MEEPAFRTLLGRTADCEMLTRVLVAEESGFTGIHMEPGPAPRFLCSCNQEKMEAVVRTLPIPERMELVQKKEPVAIHCQFCNQRYKLTIDECIVAWNRKERL